MSRGITVHSHASSDSNAKAVAPLNIKAIIKNTINLLIAAFSEYIVSIKSTLNYKVNVNFSDTQLFFRLREKARR